MENRENVPDQEEFLDRIRQTSHEVGEWRFAKAGFERLLEAAPKDEQKAFLEEGDLHAVLLGVKPAALLEQQPDMAERMANRLMSDKEFGKKFKAANTTGEFTEEGLQTYKGLIYNPEAIRQVIDGNRDIFASLGYDLNNPESIIEEALSGPGSSGRRIEVGLLLGYPKPDVFAEAAFFDDKSWEKAKKVLPAEVIAHTEEVIERRRQEVMDPKNVAVSQGKGLFRRHEAPGIHFVDVRNTGWAEFESSVEGTRLKKRIMDAYEYSGFDDLLLRWRRRYPDLFPKEDPPEWLKRITEQK